MTDEAAVHLRLPALAVPGRPRLSREYLEGRAGDFFNGDFRDPSAYKRQADAVRRRPLDRAALAEVLIEQNRLYGGGPKARAGIGRLADERAGAVVTGQQVGLFSGPLYTIYKALTAIRLAEHLSGRGEGPVVPVFWMATDDHDAAEVDHIDVLDRENHLQRIRLAFPAAEAMIPLSGRPVPAEIEEAVRRLGELTADSEFKTDVLNGLGEDYAAGRPFAEAFARWLTRLLGDSGLIFIDPGDPRLRALGAEVFRREIEGGSPSTRRALETSARLSFSGYEPAIHLHETMLNLFYVDGERRSIQSKDGVFALKETGQVFSRESLIDEAAHRPDRFSPNVLLRPLYQDALLPTIAYVGGPGEIAYFAQMKGVYESFDLPMPIIYPRRSLTILEPPIARILAKYSLAVDAIWRDAAGTIDRLTEGLIPEAVRAGLARANEHLDADLEALKAAIAAFEPTLGEAAGQTQGRIRQQLEFLDKKVRQAAKKKDEIVRRQLQKAVDHIYPKGGLQERVFNVTPYLIKYGPSFLERLAGSIGVDTFDHEVFVP
jgi:bacillithiol synthase